MSALTGARAAAARLDGKVAMVTGAAGGIGAAVVQALAGAGAEVIGVDRPNTRSHGVRSLACDLADAGAVSKLLEECPSLDILVHAAGITKDQVIWKMDDASWSSVLRTNLDSAFWLVRGVVPAMRQAGGGAIVLVASINAERGKFGQANYAASKAGLIGFGRSVAREVGRFQIRVNMVAPGWIDTPMTQALPGDVREQAIAESVLGATGQPEDVAWAVHFLASDQSRHITGQVLRVDGGQLIA